MNSDAAIVAKRSRGHDVPFYSVGYSLRGLLDRRQLAALVAVADELHFGRAAERLGGCSSRRSAS